MSVCPKCGGDGVVFTMFEDVYTCRRCMGSGTIPPPPDASTCGADIVTSDGSKRGKCVLPPLHYGHHRFKK